MVDKVVELKPFGRLLCLKWRFAHLYHGFPHLAAGVAAGDPCPGDDPALSHAHHLQYSTVQYITLHYITVQYSTVQYSTVQYSTVQYSTVQRWLEGEFIVREGQVSPQ